MLKHGTGFLKSINKVTSGAGGAHIGFGGRPLILMQSAGDPRGGGAGGGGQGGAGGGGQGGAGGDPTGALSEDAKKEVGDMVNAAVNGAINTHMTRFKKAFTEEIGKTLSESIGPIGEQLKALTERQQQAPQGGGKGNHGPAEVPQEIRDSMLRYENRIKELEQQNKAERDAREVEKTTRLREEERNKLASVLTERGIPAAQVRAAVALLHTEDKRVARTEDGRIVFKFERGTGQGKYVDELEVDKGVDEWLKSDEGKAYIPARQANGAGGQPARQGTLGNSPGEKKAQATQDLAKILLGGGVG